MLPWILVSFVHIGGLTVMIAMFLTIQDIEIFLLYLFYVLFLLWVMVTPVSGFIYVHKPDDSEEQRHDAEDFVEVPDEDEDFVTTIKESRMRKLTRQMRRPLRSKRRSGNYYNRRSEAGPAPAHNNDRDDEDQIRTRHNIQIPRVHSLFDLRSLHDQQDVEDDEECCHLPPSYSLATGLDTLPPSYEETNNKQVRLGPYIMVIDKNEKQVQKYKK